MWLFDDVFSGLCVAVLLTALLLLLRLVSVMPWRRWKGDGSGGSFAAKGRGCGGTASTLVVMGSGGHTTEMLGLIKVLPKAMLALGPQYSPRTYVSADTDRFSCGKIEVVEGVGAKGEECCTDWSMLTIPRSREVRQ
eukprot:gene22136-24419_t